MNITFRNNYIKNNLIHKTSEKKISTKSFNESQFNANNLFSKTKGKSRNINFPLLNIKEQNSQIFLNKLFKTNNMTKTAINKSVNFNLNEKNNLFLTYSKFFKNKKKK